jgi:hypothetical protein
MLSEVHGVQHQFKPKNMHFYGIFYNNLWIYCSKEGKLPNLKKILAIMNMHVP